MRDWSRPFTALTSLGRFFWSGITFWISTSLVPGNRSRSAATLDAQITPSGFGSGRAAFRRTASSTGTRSRITMSGFGTEPSTQHSIRGISRQIIEDDRGRLGPDAAVATPYERSEPGVNPQVLRPRSRPESTSRKHPDQRSRLQGRISCGTRFPLCAEGPSPGLRVRSLTGRSRDVTPSVEHLA